MSGISEPSIYEKALAKSDGTDVCLVVGGKKLYVNKAILSHHSTYFKSVFDFFKIKFNPDVKGQLPIPEIQFQDVDFEHFATLLSLVHSKPVMPTEQNAEKILELAERFMIPSVNQHIELFLLNTKMHRLEKIRIGDKYQLDKLIQNGIEGYPKDHVFTTTTGTSDVWRGLFDKTKVKYFTYLLRIKET